MTVRVSEYYDIFDVRYRRSNGVVSLVEDDSLPKSIADTNQSNSFSGFSNWSNFATQNIEPNAYSAAQTQGTANPGNNIQAASIAITGQSKAPQAITNIRIDDNGDIWCYPPNVSVPHWTRIIFRNYDYEVIARQSTDYDTYVKKFNKDLTVTWPSYDDDGAGGFDPSGGNNLSTLCVLSTYDQVPLFLKFDEYPSRSKVIFSSADKTRNPDIEFRFGYAKGQMEPIKLNLSFSCNAPQTDGTYNYNHNLEKDDLVKILGKCYWSIEWIYERESGN